VRFLLRLVLCSSVLLKCHSEGWKNKTSLMTHLHINSASRVKEARVTTQDDFVHIELLAIPAYQFQVRESAAV